MKNTFTKLKTVFIPFLVTAIATILFYNLFRWAFDLKFGILHLKEDLVNFWIPFVLPWIPVLICLRRRIRILKVKGKNDNGFFFYQFIMVGAIAVPIIISQNYLEKASFQLNEVENISDIENTDSEKYFQINSFEVDHNASLPYITGRTSGRNNESLTFYLYLACPFRQGNGTFWYGVEYSERISNYKSDEEKQQRYKTFLASSFQRFETYDFNNVKYFEKVPYSDERDGYLAAIQEKYADVNEESLVILVPKNEEFHERLGNSFPWIFGSFGIGALVVFLMVIIPSINEQEYKNLRARKPLKDDGLKDIVQYLNPVGENKAAAILININILVFLWMVFSGMNIMSPTPQELLEIGGNRRMEVESGEYWRLFTSVFIHGGIVHLFMNMIGLSIGATLLEPIIKLPRLLIIYILCGILASYTSILWHTNTVSVGASGAIFGLYGLILAFNVWKVYSKEMRGVTWLLLGLYAGVSLVFGMLGGIDNAAHIGGLVSGFVIGSFLSLIGQKRFMGNAR